MGYEEVLKPTYNLLITYFVLFSTVVSSATVCSKLFCCVNKFSILFSLMLVPFLLFESAMFSICVSIVRIVFIFVYVDTPGRVIPRRGYICYCQHFSRWAWLAAPIGFLPLVTLITYAHPVTVDTV